MSSPAPATHNHLPLFSSILHSLSQTPYRLRRRLLATWTPEQELNQVRERSGADMKKKLEWYDLVALGVGGMLGAGVFITTGQVASKLSGPAVCISYIIAGVCAFLSSLCYTEFSVEIPVAGGAFSYLRVTFGMKNRYATDCLNLLPFGLVLNALVNAPGEFVGYFGGANILLEYVLSNAAVARSFTEYLSATFGLEDLNSWRIVLGGLSEDYNSLDIPAFVLVFLLTLCLCYSTKESSRLNLLMTVFHVIFFGFVIIAGFYNGSLQNLVKPKGFAPFGVKGVVDGAAIVYFSYIGYDTVATMAEEIKHPSKILPVGIGGSVIIVSALYCLMALSLSSMIQYDKISEGASFSSAFQSKVGWKWAGNVVGAGASLGIVASLLVAMLGQARYLCVIGRARLVPSWLANVHPSTRTPMNATIFLGICTASIALFTDLEVVLEMISIGTLMVFYLVANALIYRRYVSLGANEPLPILVFLLLLTASSLGFSISWKLERSYWWLMALFGALTVTITGLFQCKVPCHHRPLKWSMPLMPWPAAASVFLNIFLMSSLKKRSYQRFAVWNCMIVLFYVLYGVHSTFKAEEVEMEMEREMALVDGIEPNSSSQLDKLEA